MGGCDVLELAREFGTPAYVYAEDDIRARARAYMDAFRAAPSASRWSTRARHSPAPRPAGSSPRRGSRRTWPPAASFTSRSRAASPGALLHARQQQDRGGARVRAGTRVSGTSSSTRSTRSTGSSASPPGALRRVMLRVTPGIRPDTHRKIATGQEDSKFGFALDDVPRAIERCAAAGARLVGLHAHLGSQVFDLDVYDTLADVMTAAGDYPVVNMGGGFAVAYTRDQRPPPAAAYVEAMLERAGWGQGPLRAGALDGRQRGRDDLHGGHGQGDARSAHLRRGRRRHGRQHAADALRRRLRSRDRGSHRRLDAVSVWSACTASPGDILVQRRRSGGPAGRRRAGDPGTGAYGHAMASNYNAVPRPPVVFCRDGEARVVVRRETYEDLTSRDA